MYIGQSLQVAYPSYTNIDDISGSFNGVTTSFALTVGGVAPVPAPLSSNQCMISVGGVVQRPDDTGAEGFRLSGGNIVFSSAPNTGEDFFGVILAGADYINVGANFPSGSASTPSITFDTDLDTGIYSPAANQLGIATAGVGRLIVDSAGRVTIGTSSAGTIASFTDGTQNLTIGTASGNVGFINGAAGFLGLYTSGVERGRVDNFGKLLLGSSSAFTSVNPAALQVTAGGIGIGTYVGASSGTQTLEFVKSRSSTVGGTTIVAAGDLLGQITFNGTDGSQAVSGALIRAEVDGTPGVNDMPGRLVLATTADGASSPTERMRIISSGAILVNDTALRDFSNQSFQVSGYSVFYQTSSGTTASVFTHTASGTQTICAFRQGNPAVAVGSIAVSGGSSTAYNTSSDYRLKENIVSVTDGIIRLQQLKPSRFNFIANPDNTVDGFIAHEVQDVVPEAITGEKDAVDDDGNPIYQGIDQSKLVPLLTAALQEAVAKIESLEARLTAAGI